MAARDIIVIGGSAGGVQAVREVVRGLPHDLAAAVFVAVHTAPYGPGALAELLDRDGTLPAAFATDGEQVRSGQIYVAPPDHHLIFRDGHVRVTRGPRENGFRPAIDPLFRTAAQAHGPRVVGVVLSGGLDDGTQGMAQIKRHGGVTLAQDPADADFPSMPQSAIRAGVVDHVVSTREIPSLLARLVRGRTTKGAKVMSRGARMNPPDVAEVGDQSLRRHDIHGPPSGFTCPECGGALWELRDGELVRFRCHVGHSYTDEGLLVGQDGALEPVLWSALRALEEKGAMARRMAQRSRASRYDALAGHYEKLSDDAEQRAAVIRALLTTDKGRTVVGKRVVPPKGIRPPGEPVIRSAERPPARRASHDGASGNGRGRKHPGAGTKSSRGRAGRGDRAKQREAGTRMTV